MPENQAITATRYHPVDDRSLPANRKVALAQRFGLFSDVSPADCTTVVSAASEKDFARKQMIFFEGDPGGHIWMLLSGCAKITQFGQNGSEVILRLARPGDVLGALGLRTSHRLSSTAQALEPCRMLMWGSNVFEVLSARFSTLHRNVARILEERLRDMEERFREVSTEKVAARLSSQLVRLAGQIGRPQMKEIEIGLSQQELAQLTGTTLFTVSRLLSQWERLGTVKTRREVVSICDLQALTAIAATE